MKTLVFAGILVLAGCTTAPQTTTQTRPEPLRKTYTAGQMAKTGRQTPGGALEELDPSITVSQSGHN